MCVCVCVCVFVMLVCGVHVLVFDCMHHIIYTPEYDLWNFTQQNDMNNMNALVGVIRCFVCLIFFLGGGGGGGGGTSDKTLIR